MTTPTSKPVPSNQPADLLFNAEALDAVVNSDDPTFGDRLGNERLTLKGAFIEINASVDAVDAHKSEANAAIDGKVTAVDERSSEAIGEINAKVDNIDAIVVDATETLAMNLGEDTADPTLRRNGSPLQAGDFYVNSLAVPKQLRMYSGLAWETLQKPDPSLIAAAASVAGIVATFDTKALATAGLAGIPADAAVMVLIDESQFGATTVYRKTGGVLVYKTTTAVPGKRLHGSRRIHDYPRGSVLVHVGDSRSMGQGPWGAAHLADWFGAGGVFEGWTDYNMGSNGSSVAVWVASIATGDTAAIPQDYPLNNTTPNVWQVVNANPAVVSLSLLTNDLRMDGSPARYLQAVTDLATLVNFFLANTSAQIILRMPPPFAYANPDPAGNTNFTNADDAAARSANIRAAYLAWEGVSNRLVVIDTHKAIYGLRTDSVAGSTDPQGQGALMTDTLHPTALGARREAQAISRAINPMAPATVSFPQAPIDVVKNGLLSTLVNVFQVGNGFMSIRANLLAGLFGNQQKGGTRNGPLAQTAHNSLALMLGAASRLHDVLRCSGLRLRFLDDDTVVDVSAFTTSFGDGDGISTDFARIVKTGTVYTKTGLAMLYAISEDQLPAAKPLNLPVEIQINGPQPLTVNADGCSPLPMTTVVPTFDLVTGTRQDATSATAAVIELYAQNNFNGAYIISGGDNFSYPGKLLGTLTFAQSRRQSPVWAVDATNFPGGVVTFARGAGVVLYARVVAGTLGRFGTVAVRLT